MVAGYGISAQAAIDIEGNCPDIAALPSTTTTTTAPSMAPAPPALRYAKRQDQAVSPCMNGSGIDGTGEIVVICLRRGGREEGCESVEGQNRRGGGGRVLRMTDFFGG